MPDLVENLCAKHAPRAQVSVVRIVGRFARLICRQNVEQGVVARRVVFLEPIDEFSDQIAVAPTDDLGAAQFGDEKPNKADSNIGFGLGNPDGNFQFFDTAFQDRPFLSRLGGFWLLHPDLSGKGRPACAVAA